MPADNPIKKKKINNNMGAKIRLIDSVSSGGHYRYTTIITFGSLSNAAK